jgi:hypothetical protein
MLYQLSYPAVGGRIIENCPGFVKKPGSRLFSALVRVGVESCVCPDGEDFGVIEHIRWHSNRERADHRVFRVELPALRR